MRSGFQDKNKKGSKTRTWRVGRVQELLEKTVMVVFGTIHVGIKSANLSSVLLIEHAVITWTEEEPLSGIHIVQ